MHLSGPFPERVLAESIDLLLSGNLIPDFRRFAPFHALQPDLDRLRTGHGYKTELTYLLPGNARAVHHNLLHARRMPGKQDMPVQPVQVQTDMCTDLRRKTEAHHHAWLRFPAESLQFKGLAVSAGHFHAQVQIAQVLFRKRQHPAAPAGFQHIKRVRIL